MSISTKQYYADESGIRSASSTYELSDHASFAGVMVDAQIFTTTRLSAMAV